MYRPYFRVNNQTPTWFLAKPLVSDRVAVLHKTYYALAGRSCGKQSSSPSGRELFAFEVRIEPAEE